LSEGSRQMVASDGLEDTVFVTLCEPGELLWLNHSLQPVTKLGKAIPSWSIATTGLR